MKRTWTACLLALTLFFAAARPASAILDKTRFVARLGIAYFCFHHWVLNPYHAGAFAQGAPHRTKSIIKAGVAMLFAVHEIKKADQIAHNSRDPLLQKLSGSIDSMEGTFASVGNRLKGGSFQPSDVTNTDQELSSVNSQASAGGMPIKDVAVPVPGG